MNNGRAAVEKPTNGHSFESDYFSDIYGGNYHARNPRYKINFYLKTILKFKKSGTLFDIGCAYGLFCKAAARNFDCTGCDVSAHAVREATQSVSSRGAHFFVSNLPDIPTEKKYDVITCFDVLEHVPDLVRALQNLRDLSADSSGILVLTVPVYDGMFAKIAGFLDNDPTHIHKESRNFWKKSLAENGFEIVESVGVFRYFLMGKMYVHFGHALLWPIAPAIVMVVRRDRSGRKTK
jgi:SAM-dependent methyltransferase